MKNTKPRLRQIIKEEASRLLEYESNEYDDPFDDPYPFTLGYTNDDGEEVRVVVNDSSEIDAAFEEMYASSSLGYDIPYSID
jgi:hypothetical protein